MCQPTLNKPLGSCYSYLASNCSKVSCYKESRFLICNTVMHFDLTSLSSTSIKLKRVCSGILICFICMENFYARHFMHKHTNDEPNELRYIFLCNQLAQPTSNQWYIRSEWQNWNFHQVAKGSRFLISCWRITIWSTNLIEPPFMGPRWGFMIQNHFAVF